MDGYIKKSEAVDVIVKYPYEIAGKTATAIKMIEDLPSADVVPKSEVDKWYCEYHTIKDVLKQEKMYHRGTEKLVDKYCTELEKAKAEIETLKDNNEHLAVILEETKAEVESIITLNSQLEAKVFEQRKEIERLKKYNTDVAFKHYNDGKAEVASEIFAEIYERLLLSFPAQSFIDAPCTTHDRLFNMVAELKKKYTEIEVEN